MLDQLVAFCGDTIVEDDVLSVFGFTGQETITSLCDAVLEGDTPSALETVYQQSASGKDLSRLMADLIGHLRNLLVLKADPNALKHDPSVTNAGELGIQAEKIGLGRLLELVDQFADAEGRMKWAPNKKLHFEIAIIKAIQTLSQATLDEVIDTLASIRGGNAPAPRAAAPVPRPKAIARPATPKPPEPTARVAEPPAEPPTAPTSQPAPEGLAEIWTQTLIAIREQRPLILSWVEHGTLVACAGGRATIAFPPEQALARDSVSRPSTLRFVADVLATVMGGEVEFSCLTQEGLVVTPPALPEKEPEKVIDPMENFRNDELIKAALEIFKGEIHPA